VDTSVTGIALPWGFFNSKVTGVPLRGTATVRFVLPPGSAPSSYIKEDPVTGARRTSPAAATLAR
jgi:hypothetical protein